MSAASAAGERLIAGDDHRRALIGAETINDMSRDTSQIGSDRRLWLSEPCPSCAARAGRRCQTSRYSGKPTHWLHGARGWPQRPCPTCKAAPGELCTTPSGQRAGRPHTARLSRARRELLADQQVWEQLEQWGASMALVRFSGGGGNPGSIQAVTLKNENENEDELARYSSGEGELPGALAAPIWGRYALFRGHPPITGLLIWNARARSIQLAGTRGGQKFDEILSTPRQIATVTIAPPAAGRQHAARHLARHLATGGGNTHIRRAAERLGNLALVPALRRSVGGGAASGGALLLQALPPSRLPRPAAPALRTRRPATARALRPLPRPDAQRRATRGPLLLKALPPSRLPRPARARTQTKPNKRAPGATSRQRHLQQPPNVSDTSRDTSPPPMPATLRAIGFELVLHVDPHAAILAARRRASSTSDASRDMSRSHRARRAA